MKLLPLASSSSGNAYVLKCAGGALLVDCGISYRMLGALYDVKKLAAVLITHDHVDHVSGLARLVKERALPVYANVMTAEAIQASGEIADDAFVCFENGQSFEIGAMEVTPFSIPHDAVDPVGYLVKAEGETYFHGTDIGSPLDSIGGKLSEADIATLESNHDTRLLFGSNRPHSLIQRIAGPRGHLANDEAADLVKRFASPKLKRLYLAHLSRQCNDPLLARSTMLEALKSIGRADVELEVCE